MREFRALQMFAMVAVLVIGAPKVLSSQEVQPVALSVWVQNRTPVTADRSGVLPAEMPRRAQGKKRVLLGAFIGTVAGGGTAYLLAKQSCQRVCDDGAPILVPTALFAVLGGIGGAIVGQLSREKSVRQAAAASPWPPTPLRRDHRYRAP